MRISDWSSDVCSSDLPAARQFKDAVGLAERERAQRRGGRREHAKTFAACSGNGGCPLLTGSIALSMALPFRFLSSTSLRTIATSAAKSSRTVRSAEPRDRQACVTTCGYRWLSEQTKKK